MAAKLRNSNRTSNFSPKGQVFQNSGTAPVVDHLYNYKPQPFLPPDIPSCAVHLLAAEQRFPTLLAYRHSLEGATVQVIVVEVRALSYAPADYCNLI